jgi:hypothetical protein
LVRRRDEFREDATAARDDSMTVPIILGEKICLGNSQLGILRRLKTEGIWSFIYQVSTRHM